METLLKEIDKILKEKNERISLLEWQKERFEEEIKELKQEIIELKNDLKRKEEK